MTASLHRLDDPSALLTEVRRVLAPGGCFLLCEWERRPQAKFAAARLAEGEALATIGRERLLGFYSMTHRFTAEDWRWLLGRAGLSVEREVDLGDHFLALMAVASA